jgi:phytoene dehydrogenase-like protein
MNTICPGSIDILLSSYDVMARGLLPRNIMVGASCISTADRTRAPPGKALLHAVVMVKPDPADGGWENWDNLKATLAERVFAYLRRHVHNLGPENIRAVHIVTPEDHESDNPSFNHGDIT